MDATVQMGSLVGRCGALVFSAVEGDVTMMNMETGKYYGLATVGARIWALIEQPMQVTTVCDRLVAEYRVDRQKCETEILSFLQTMADEGVVTLISHQSGAGDGR